MIPFRIGDDVRIEGGDWFAGATGSIKEVYESSGTLMVELDEYVTKRIPRGLTLPFAPSELAPTRCQHPLVGDSELRGWLTRHEWQEDPPRCSDCYEWLYPALLDDGSIRVYVGEPKGAGDDYWDRPDPRTHPEAWKE